MKNIACFILSFFLATANAVAGNQLTLTSVSKSEGFIPPSITFNQTNTGCITTNTCTFSTQAIGSAGNRYVVLSIAYDTSASATISSITIGGISAASIVSVSAASGAWTTALWGANVPTGTTASYVINWTANVNSNGAIIGSWSIYDLVSTTPDNTQTNTASPGNISVTTVNDGVAIVACGRRSSSGTPSCTLTGIGTVDFNSTGSGNTRSSGGSALTTGATINATATYAGSISTASAFVGASFH